MTTPHVDSGEPDKRLHLVFVCTGNICRSPMAEAITRSLAREHGFEHDLEITSAGTGEWHVGEQADPRTQAALARAGYEVPNHRAKQFDPASFDDYDLIVTFDRGQRRILRAWAENDAQRMLIHPLCEFDPVSNAAGEVPDPYYGNDELFDRVLVQIERACKNLLTQIEPAVRAARGETNR